MVRSQLKTPDLPYRHPVEILMWLMGRRRRLRVRGDSMLPRLRDGDVVLVDDSAYRGTVPVTGDIVVALHPYIRHHTIVKRVAEVGTNERVMLRGDNPADSTDSGSFGALRYDKIIAKVTCRL